MEQWTRKRMVFFVPKEYNIPREDAYPRPEPLPPFIIDFGPIESLKESGRDEAAHVEEQAVGETEEDIRRT
jgi:hypothetical protein